MLDPSRLPSIHEHTAEEECSIRASRTWRTWGAWEETLSIVEQCWAYFSWCVFSQMSTKQLSIISIHTFNFTYYFYARVPALFQSLWPNGSWNQWALKVLIPRLSQQRQRLNAIIARLTWLGSWMQHTKRTLILSICPPASTHQHLRCYPHPCYSCKLNFHVHQNKEPSDNL